MQAWLEKGLNPKGYLVCKFAFKVRIFRSQPYGSHRVDQRLLGQPALPIRDTESDEDAVHDNSDIKQGDSEEDEKAAVDMTVLDDSDIERDE